MNDFQKTYFGLRELKGDIQLTEYLQQLVCTSGLFGPEQRLLRKGNHHLVKWSVILRTYLIPRGVSGRGPSKSEA